MDIDIQQEFDDAAYKTELELFELRRRPDEDSPLQKTSLEELTGLLQQLRKLIYSVRELFVPDTPEKFVQWKQNRWNRPEEDEERDFDSVAYRTELQLLELRGLIWDRKRLSDVQADLLKDLTGILREVKKWCDSLRGPSGVDSYSDSDKEGADDLRELEQRLRLISNESPAEQKRFPESSDEIMKRVLEGIDLSKAISPEELVAKIVAEFAKAPWLSLGMEQGQPEEDGPDIDKGMDGSPPVPAATIKPPPVRSGGATRSFEEAEEPPRNP